MIRYARKRLPCFAWDLFGANQERKQVVNDNNFVNAFATICSFSCPLSLSLSLSVGLQGVGGSPSRSTFDIVFWSSSSSSVGGIKPHASRFIIAAEAVGNLMMSSFRAIAVV